MNSRSFFCPQCGAYVPQDASGCTCGGVVSTVLADDVRDALADTVAATSATPSDALSSEPEPSHRLTVPGPGVVIGLFVLLLVASGAWWWHDSTKSRAATIQQDHGTTLGTSTTDHTSASGRTVSPKVQTGTEMLAGAESASFPSASHLTADTFTMLSGRWQLTQGELHPATGQLVRSFLEVVRRDGRTAVIWTSELDGMQEHLIELTDAGDRLVGDHYGVRNVTLTPRGENSLLFSIDPFAEFEPIRKSVYARVQQRHSGADVGAASRNVTCDYADVQEFFRAFQEAAASSDVSTLAECVAFPFDQQMAMMTKDEFIRNYKMSGDELRLLLATAAPTRYEGDLGYGVNTPVFAMSFKRNSRGYWKWTDIYYGE